METRRLIAKAHSGDKMARDTLVKENQGLVWNVVRRFAGRGYELEDLFQIGCIGILKAIDRFDLSKEVMFSTYAVPMIMGEIKRFLRDDGMIKVSRSLKERGYHIGQARKYLTQEYGREPLLEEISEYMGLTVEEIVVATEANADVESLYRSVYAKDGDEVYMVDSVANEKEKDEYGTVIDRLMIEEVMDKLEEQERMLIKLRYYQNLTQSSVAKEMGISQVQVSRAEKKLLLKLRNSLC